VKPLLPPQLLALSPGGLTLGEGYVARVADLLQRVRAARRAGLRGVLLREAQLPDGPYAELAASLKAILEENWLGLHDRPHLVEPVGAQAVHLGFRSLSARQARECVGPDVAIGVSTHSSDGPESWEGADYLFHGPVFPPLSKTGNLPAVGVLGLRAFVGRARLPVWGLGGITPEQAASVLQAGAKGVACLGGLLSHADPSAACARFGEVLAR
jgi:thiamine-phosphate pyrophosphorylase